MPWWGLARSAGDREAQPLDAADKNLIRALAGECALAVEKERLTRANAAIAALAQQEKLRADVLRAVSHDLRTPLTTVCGNAAVLADTDANIDPAGRRGLWPAPLRTTPISLSVWWKTCSP